MFDKVLHYTKTLFLKNPFSMFSAKFISIASHLKIHPAIHLNTSKTLISLKVYSKFTSFRYSYLLIRVRKR